MASQILLNFAVPFTELDSAGAVDFSYLRKAAIVVKPKDANAEDDISEVYDMEGVAAITDNAEAGGFFDGGLNRVHVISAKTLAGLNAIVESNENSFFSLHISSDFTDAETLAHNYNFNGVITSGFDTSESAKTFAGENCSEVSTLQSKGRGVCYAIARLMSQRSFWGNQQYISYDGSAVIDTVSSKGLAESHFDDRLTFWLYDEDNGTRLAGFFCGGKAITEKFISEELKLTLQSEAVKYISANQPMNTRDMRVAVQNHLQSFVDEYIDDDYLDDEGANEIIITESKELFWVNATLRVSYSEPIWRMAVTAIKE